MLARSADRARTGAWNADRTKRVLRAAAPVADYYTSATPAEGCPCFLRCLVACLQRQHRRENFGLD